MPRFVALLRGVNVGKARRVPMAQWRTLLAGLGYQDVETLLNSGNAAFTATGGTSMRHARDIADALRDALGVEVPVIVKSARELATIVAECPITPDASAHARFLVAFAQDTHAVASLAPVRALVDPPEEFALGPGAAYLLCAKGILESKAGEALLGKAGREHTTRNWATVQKLLALAQSGGA